MRRSATDGLGAALRILAFATLAVPFVAAPGFLFPFVVPRAVLFRGLMAAAVVLLIGVLVLRRPLAGRRDPILIALVVFFFASTASAFAGVAVYRSLYGNLERMWGVWGWFNVAVLYVLLRAAFDERGWNAWLRASLWLGGILGLYAFVQHMDWSVPFVIADRGRPFATLGNAAYLGIYLFLAGGLGLLLRARDARSGWIGWLDRAALLLIAIGLVLANTRSVLLGLVIGGMAGAAVLVATGSHSQRARALRIAIGTAALAAVVVLLAVAFPEISSGIPGLNRLAATSAENTNVRLVAWRIGLEGFRARPLLGWGMDNFGAIFDAALTPDYFSTPVYNIPFDRVHNAYVELLATGGVVGLLAFLAIFAAAGWMIVDGWRRSTLSRAECAIFTGVFAGYLLYLVFWFEDLNSLIVLTATLALLGSRSSDVPLLRIGAARSGRALRYMVVGVVTALVVAALWLHAWKPLIAARALAQLDRTNIGVRIPEDLVETALDADLSRTHALTIMTLQLRALMGRLDEIRSDPDGSAAVARRLERTLIAIEREIERDPYNSALQVHRANLLLVAALLMRTPELYESALAAFDDAIRLSPNQVHHRYRLAEALTLTGRIDEAMAQLDSAAAIAPAFGATDYFRARFSLLRGDLDGATTAARAAIAKGYVSDARLGLRLDDALAGAGRPLHLRIALLRAFLLERRGTVGLHAARPGRAASDRPLIERLALLQSEAGDDESARRLRALVSADSAAAAAR